MTTQLSPETPAHAFTRSGKTNLFLLMAAKQDFFAEMPADAAIAEYAQLLGLDASLTRAVRRSLSSLRDFSEAAAPAFRELAPAGEPFRSGLPKVMGPSDHRELSGKARSQYVACLQNVTVRGRSAFIDTGELLLLDYEGDELKRTDDHLELDPGILKRDSDILLSLASEHVEDTIDVAFSLLGPHSYAFGHWIWFYLPRLSVALESAHLPDRVDVLIDHGMPEQHRQALALLLPDTYRIREVKAFQAVRVRQLWTAPSIEHAPILEEFNERFRWDHVCPPPARFAAMARAVERRVSRSLEESPDATRRIFIARRANRRRKMMNRKAIEALVLDYGFELHYPEDLSFAEQHALFRSATHIIGPDGSGLALAMFARPQTRLCILTHPQTAGQICITGFLAELGVDCTLLTGPNTRYDEDNPHFSDYRIPVQRLQKLLDRWFPTSSSTVPPLPSSPDQMHEAGTRGHRAVQRPTVTAFLSVKDEIEILPLAVEHLYRIGVDQIIACDMKSSDGTLEWLEKRTGARLSLHQVDDHEPQLTSWFRLAADSARNCGTDWILYQDADEFLLSAEDSLKQHLARTPADIISVQRFNWIPALPAPMSAEQLLRNHWDQLSLITHSRNDFRAALVEDESLPWILAVPAPKVLARTGCVGKVLSGAHGVQPPEGKCCTKHSATDMLMVHAPFTTPARFGRKIENIRAHFQVHNAALGADEAWHWRRWLTLADEGKLDDEFSRSLLAPARLVNLRQQGMINTPAQWFAANAGRR